jgi:tetrapyrrole methylase family protein/MazG family protein
VLEKLAEEVAELEYAVARREKAEEFGDILMNLVNYARYQGIDAEEALRLSASKFRRRFEAVESSAREGATFIRDMSIEELLRAWQMAKAGEVREAES